MHTAITWVGISFEYLLSARHSDELWEDFGGAVNMDCASAKHIDSFLVVCLVTLKWKGSNQEMGLHILMFFVFLSFLKRERTWTQVKEESGKSWGA